MKVGVYVGSFDPVHIGHKHIADYLLSNNYLDRVIIVPTTTYWNKNNLTDLKHRINMLKYYQSNKIIINDKYNTRKYTYQILNNLKKDYPEDTLYLIIGADNLVKFHLWQKIDKILKNKVIVLPRKGIDIYKYINNYPEKDCFIALNNFKEIDISSSLIRKKINAKDYQNIDKYLDKNILNYIIQNNLYNEKNNIKAQG